jgi:hypothetical protein
MRGPRHRLVVVTLLVAAVVPTAARAHQQGVSYSDVTVADGRVRYDLTISNHDLQEIDADRDGAISESEVLAQYATLRRHFEHALVVQAGDTPCPLTLQDFLIDPTGAVTFRLRGPCPDGAPLRIAFQLLAMSAAPGYDLAKIAFRGAITQYVFTREDTTLVIAGGDESPMLSGRRLVVLGATRVVTGYEHVLFVLALLLVGGGLRGTASVVAAWSVAYNVTLALATFEVLVPPARLVEAAVAMSLAWIALENILFDPRGGRWRTALLLGLVHGFALASVLRMTPSLGHPVESFAWFSCGVELGLVAMVVLVYPVIAAIQGTQRRRVLVTAASSVILVVALWRLVERAFLA